MALICLVEDNPDNADLIQDILGDTFELIIFNTPAAAIGKLSAPDSRKPDLFLLDISLPGMDGVQLLREFRANPKFEHTPAIALTAHARACDCAIYLAAGFNRHISKPITDEAILFQALREQIR